MTRRGCFMKKLLTNLSIFLFLYSSFFIGGCQKKGVEISDVKREQKVVATFVLGKVAKKLNNGEWDIVKVGDTIGSKEVVKLSEKSRLVLQTETGSVITLTDEAEVSINSILNPSSGDENTEVKLSEGKAVVNPRDIKGLSNSSFSVRTPAMVAGVRGTVFSIEYKEGKSKVMVKEGKVAVKPAIKVEESKQEKLPEIEVTEGQKTVINKDDVKELEKKLEEGKVEVNEITSISKVDNIVDETEKKMLEDDAKQIVKFDNIKFDENSGSVVKEDLYFVTVIAVGSDIYINGEMKAKDYLSASYPKGKILIEIKQDQNIVMSKEVELNSDITVDYTPVEKMKEEINKTIENKELSPLYKLNLGDSNVYIASDNVIGLTESKVIFTDNKKTIKEVFYDSKVKPFITNKAVFTYEGGNVAVYSSEGNMINKIKLGTIIFPTDFVFSNGIAYLYDSTGKVIGVNTKGQKVFEEKVRGSISGIGVSNNYVVIATVSNVYIVENGKIISEFGVDSSSKIINKVSVIGDTKKMVIVPQDNNIISLRDLSGNILKKISAVPGDIETINNDVFAVTYSNKVVFYNLDGSKIKEIKVQPKMYFIVNGYVYTWSEKKIFRYGIDSEKTREMPEDVLSVSLYNNKMVVYTRGGNIYHIDF